MLKWKLSLAETISFGMTVAALTFFVTSTYQTKSDAREAKELLEQWKAKVERKFELNDIKIDKIADDVSWIRGKLEKNK